MINRALKTNKMRLYVVLLMVWISSSASAQTQLETNQITNNVYEKADKELNDLYHKILIEYKTDTVFIKNLKASQRIWITFRDAELKMKFPEREPGYYGSVLPMCVASYLEKLTRERIKTLKVWIDGIQEGDACNGSVKTKE